MTSATDITRRRRARSSGQSLLQGAFKWILFPAILTSGVLFIILAVLYANLTAGFPPVEEIEFAFGVSGAEAFQPVSFYDRSGENLIFEIIHPDTIDRKWMRILPGGVSTIPDHALNALIAVLDETYWTNPGYDPGSLASITGSLIRQLEDETISPGITQRLAMTYLVPPRGDREPAWVDFVRSSLLAADLTHRYSKEQILEWYVNSVYFGHMAYGIDAASLLYFDKHAVDLSLAESAVLAAFIDDPDLPHTGTLQEIQAAQDEVIDKMIQLDLIETSFGESARESTLEIQQEFDIPSSYSYELVMQAWNQIEGLLGPNLLHRGGLRVVTTIDIDLQLQAQCAAKTHMGRLAGGSLELVVEAQDQTACVAAGLLPNLRPRDLGEDHHVSDFSIVVIDPSTGQILSMLGPALQPQSSGSIFQPFIYVTAFAQGYSPGSMILDVQPSSDVVDAMGVEFTADTVEYNGPVRIRTALANSYRAAAIEAVDLLGVDSVLRTAELMGLRSLGDLPGKVEVFQVAEMLEIDLLDTTFAYSLFANYGKLSGASMSTDSNTMNQDSVSPILVLGVQDAAGRWIYASETQVQAVLSSQLAYLMADILSDEAARLQEFGRFGVLDIGRSAGVQTGIVYQNTDNWTIGFTPSHVVGVWIGNLDDAKMRNIDALNGATAIWHAVIRYASRDVPQTGWTVPPGINHLEVCDPSGLLPTEYCPVTVRETYIAGTEPTTYDNLFQPYAVNRETGKLATMMTPVDLIEERVYMLPPPGAEVWAESENIASPPTEYDTVFESAVSSPEINITTPGPFDMIRGEVSIRGNAFPEGMNFYRLQYGRGLNPIHWTQLGEDENRSVTDGLLGVWDTTGLNGLYTLQLVTVFGDDQIATSEIYVTVDNIPPDIRLLSPTQGLEADVDETQEIVLEVEVEDEIEVARVVFYMNGAAVMEFSTPPYSTRWKLDSEGEYVFQVKAYDQAGNLAESKQIIFSVNP
jgi:membrane peptidoglycan carboxypeptidase